MNLIIFIVINHWYVFGEIVFLILCSFFHWVVCLLLFSCRSSLHILGTRSRSDIWFVKISPHSELSLYFVDGITWSTEVFIVLQALPNPRSWRFTCVFSSKNFVVLVPTPIIITVLQVIMNQVLVNLLKNASILTMSVYYNLQIRCCPKLILNEELKCIITISFRNHFVYGIRKQYDFFCIWLSSWSSIS